MLSDPVSFLSRQVFFSYCLNAKSKSTIVLRSNIDSLQLRHLIKWRLEVREGSVERSACDHFPSCFCQYNH